jgi:hypothetical protein
VSAGVWGAGRPRRSPVRRGRRPRESASRSAALAFRISNPPPSFNRHSSWMQPTATLPRMLRMATTADPDRHAPYLPTPRYAQESTRAYAGPRVWALALSPDTASAHATCTCGCVRPPRRPPRSSLAACGAGCQHKCISILRRRWGCAAALTGARLRMSRAYLAGGWGGRSRRSRRRRRGRRLRFRRRRAYGRGEFAPPCLLGGAPAGQHRR